MAQLCVTGGSGFLGSLLVRYLLDAGHDVASIDLLPTTIEHPRLHAVIGDIRDRACLDSLFATSRPEAVFHLAAMLAHLGLKREDLWSSNATGSGILAEAAAAAGVTKVIYTSSNCLWGTNYDRLVTEDDPPAPVELYGESKWEGEKLLLAQRDLTVTAIRCPTIVDEGRLGLLTILFEFIADGRRVWTVGAGDNRYQFIYAADLINAMVRAWQVGKGGIYGIGSDNVPTMRETYAHVIAQSGSTSRVASLPKAPTIAAMKLAHMLRISPLGPYHYRMIASNFVFDTTRIKTDLGWQPTLTNSDMLLRAYRYYHAHRAEITGRKQASAHHQAADMGVIRLLKWLS